MLNSTVGINDSVKIYTVQGNFFVYGKFLHLADSKNKICYVFQMDMGSVNKDKKDGEKFTVSSSNRKLFGERLKSFLKEKGVSQDKFAEAIGISLSTAKKWCAGSYVPDVDELQKIYQRFNVSLDWLVLGIESSDEFINPYLPIDSIILEAVISAVDSANKTYGLSLSDEKRAKIYTILYEEASSDNKTNLNKRALQLLSLIQTK